MVEVNPEDLQGKYHDAAEDDGEVHWDDPPVRREELLVDISGILWPWCR